MTKHLLWTVGFGLVDCDFEVSASEGNCLLEQVNQDMNAGAHPTEQNVLMAPLHLVHRASLDFIVMAIVNEARGRYKCCRAEMTEEFLIYTKSKGNISSFSPIWFPRIKDLTDGAYVLQGAEVQARVA